MSDGKNRYIAVYCDYILLQLGANWRKSNILKHQPMVGTLDSKLGNYLIVLYDAKNQLNTSFSSLQMYISVFHP
jgi:hypothetical protein